MNKRDDLKCFIKRELKNRNEIRKIEKRRSDIEIGSAQVVTFEKKKESAS